MRDLTKPQRELLASLPTTCSESYAPAKRLVALGLAVWEEGRFGSTRLVPAPAINQQAGGRDE